jgi:thiol-disulfide isomerase/thioredoxin
MAQSPTFRFFALSLALMVIGTHAVRSQTPQPYPSQPTQLYQSRDSGDKTNMTWNIYALSELSQDAHNGKWLAETIQQVVQPQSWNTKNGQQATITYHPQGKVLVVYNTPAVQEEVSTFLSKLKKALPQEQAAAAGASNVVQAGYGVPAGTTIGAGANGTGRGSSVKAPTANYPVPSVTQPKHLFHFIIRYEGEGIIDSNVVDMVKIMYGPDAKANLAKQAAELSEAKPSEKPEVTPTSTKNTPAEKEPFKINWRTDYKSARQEASEKKLPIFIAFVKPDCPYCVKMDETTFQDAKVIGVVNEKFIALKVNCDEISELAISMRVESYPSFVFAGSDGKLLRPMATGYKDVGGFLEQLQGALSPPQLPELEPVSFTKTDGQSLGTAVPLTPPSQR